ncbi:MAG: PQQ-binding-like beta-propeller repeat protein [Spirochaetes bacterium]|nr:PQQ-binding-like beta-propeller repeat protein [Spirochaetota bacterium]
MRSLKINSDYLVIGVSALIISVCSALLYADYARKIEAGDAQQIGTITYKKKVAQRKYSSQVIWEDLDQNAPVYNNDSIRTADLSEAIIHLSDGTNLNLDENSLILLAFAGDGINIDFAHGSISTTRTAASGEAAQIKIQSKDTVVSLEEGDVKLSRSGEKELDVTVRDGTAEIKTGGDEKTIRKDEKATVTEDAGTRVVKLKLKPLSPPPGNTVVTAAPALPVLFSWAPVEGNPPVYLEIARSSEFGRETVVRAAEKNTYTENLGEGSYYWRIRAAGQAGKAFEYSDTRKITILREQPFALVYPRDNETLPYSVKPPIINFRWQESKLATEYILEISRETGFKRVVRSVSTPLQNISVDGLEAGVYFWRVRTRNEGVPSYSGTSSPTRFKIEKIAELSPPILISPPDGRRVSSSMFEGEKKFIFSWSADTQVKEYEFILAGDREFSNVVLSAKNRGNFYTLGRGLKPGRYFWRVASLPENGRAGAASAPNSLEVVATGSIRCGAPVVTAVKDFGKDEKRAAILFPWKISGFSGVSRLELSKDRGFLNVIVGKITADTRATVDAVPAGAYFWRVTIMDSDRNQIAQSDAQPLFIGVSGNIVGSADEIMPKETAAASAGEVAEKGGDKELETKKKEEEARKKEEEIARQREEELARKREEELMKKRQEEVARKLQQDVARKLQEDSSRKQQAEELAVQKRQEAAARKKAEAEAHKAEIEHKRKEREEAARLKKEEIARKRQEELARKEKRAKDKGLAPKEPPVLTIQSAVKGSTIYINKKVRGYDAVTFYPRAGEKLAVTVKADGYADYTDTVVLQNGEKKKIVAALKSVVPEYREKRPGRRLRWRANLASTVMSRPVYKNNMILATTKSGFLVGLNLNGVRLWRTALGSAARSTPAADGTSAYLVTVNGMLIAVDLRNGRIRWKKGVEGPLLFGSGPIVENGRIFIATSYGTVQAFAADGKEVWQQDLEEGIFSSMAYDSGLLYVGTDRSRVYAIDAGDGDIRWKYETDSRIFTSSPRIYRGTLFVGCYSGTFYALNAKNGWPRWRFSAPKAILSSPAFHDDTVYICSENGIVYALDAGDGKKSWEFYTRGSIVAGPDVSRDSLLVPSGKIVFSIDTGSGELNWREGLASVINTPVTVVGNAAYVGLDNGEVVSIASF